jgi:predicted XRE-type DNA-binding protein
MAGHASNTTLSQTIVALREQTVRAITEWITHNKLTYDQVAAKLRVHRPDVALLMQHDVERMSLERLLDLYSKTGGRITLTLGPRATVQSIKDNIEEHRPP